MKVCTTSWSADKGWAKPEADCRDSQWVIYFGSREALAKSKVFEHLRTLAPKAIIMGCSTGGEIRGEEVSDDTVVAACITFAGTKLKAFSTQVEGGDSYTVGQNLAQALMAPDLVNIFLLSDGLKVNGSELVRGIFDHVDSKVVVTGGLAGDGADFKLTEVGQDGPPSSGRLAAVGFYGKGLTIGYGSMGGWDTYGPERVITRSENNVLYELDGQPALDLYKKYLGEAAAKLPGSALLFPLSIRPPNADAKNTIVRTIVGVDEASKSLIFAGDVPQGYGATLMQGNFDHLVDGASKAAGLATLKDGKAWELAILVSCIGRKLLLGQRISDETEAVADVLRGTPILGFYSYGEICHHVFTQECGLHNQTMTVTLFAEV